MFIESQSHSTCIDWSQLRCVVVAVTHIYKDYKKVRHGLDFLYAPMGVHFNGQGIDETQTKAMYMYVPRWRKNKFNELISLKAGL